MCREALWTIGNLCAGPWQQVEAVFGVDDLVTRVVELLGATNLRIRREAVTVVHNITRFTGPGLQSVLVNLGCIPLLCQMITPELFDAALEDAAVQDGIQNSITDALLSLSHIIDATGVDDVREYIFHDVRALEKIKSLQHHENELLSTAACGVFSALTGLR